MMDENIKRDHLRELAQRFAEKDPRFKSTLVNYYTIDPRRVEYIEACLVGTMVSGALGHPVAGLAARIHEGQLQKIEVILTAGPPMIQCATQVIEVNLPAGNYLLLASPIIAQGSSTTEVVARDTMSMMLGLLTGLAGGFATLSYVGEQLVHADNDGCSFVSRAIRAPERPHGILFRDSSKLIGDALRLLLREPEDEQMAIRYALIVFGRAASESNEAFKFALFWMAIELIADGQGKDIARKLNDAYAESKSFALDTLRVRSAIRFRDQLVHKGRMTPLPSDMERLLHAYFLDLLRFRLGLPCLRLAHEVVRALEAIERDN